MPVASARRMRASYTARSSSAAAAVFGTNAKAPCPRASRWAPAGACALMSTTGTSGHAARSPRASSKPDAPASITSETTTSTEPSRTARSAWRMVATEVTS